MGREEIMSVERDETIKLKYDSKKSGFQKEKEQRKELQINCWKVQLLSELAGGQSISVLQD